MDRKWIDALGAVSVLAGLVFVGLEIRQNSRAVEGATVQASAQVAIDLILRGMESPQIQAAWPDVMSGRDLADFDASDRGHIGWFFTALLRIEENQFRQLSLGTVSSMEFLDFANDYLRFNAFRQFWEASKSQALWKFQPGFVDFIDGRIERSGPVWTGGPVSGLTEAG